MGWDIINFENLIYIKLYSLLILTKNKKKSKNKLQAQKKSEIVIFHVVYCHVNKTSQQYTALYTTYSHALGGKIKAIAANWCLIVRPSEDTPATLIVCPMLGRRITMWPNAVGTFNRPLASVLVYKKFVWVTVGFTKMWIKNIFKNLKTLKKIKSWSAGCTTSLQN